MPSYKSRRRFLADRNFIRKDAQCERRVMQRRASAISVDVTGVPGASNVGGRLRRTQADDIRCVWEFFDRRG
jgi:hypothetical protein